MLKTRLFIIGSLLALTTCASPERSTTPVAHEGKEGNSASSKLSEEKAYQSVQMAFSQSAFELTLQREVQFRKLYPNGRFVPDCENLAGLSFILLKRPAEAIPRFHNAIELGAHSHAFTQHVKYNLARAQFDANLVEDTEITLNGIDLEPLDQENRLKVRALKARLLSKKGLLIDSAREDLLASRTLNEAKFSQAQELKLSLRSLLEKTIHDIPDKAAVEHLYAEFENSAFADLLLYELGSREISDKNVPAAETRLRMLMTKFPDSPDYTKASDLLHSTSATAPMDATVIGVLVPLKGRFSKFGLATVQAIELALGFFDPTVEQKLSLAVEDSGDEPTQSIAALDRLVNQHHAAAVIGPLMSKGIDQISQHAEDLRVPLVTLARFTGVPSEFVFPAGLTLKQQAKELARYAIEKLKIHRFAIVAPREKAGTELSQSFWDAVESHGGEVVGIETYHPGDTDFRQAVDKLSGLYYTEARQRELEELAKLREENHIKKKTRKTEQYFNLKPIVDYEAVFVPDEPKAAGLILPMFAYRDVDHIRFLGTAAWNTTEFPARVQAAAEGAVFVDAFNPESASSNTVREMTEKFKTAFGTDPTAMDAIAYDAAKLVAQALSSNPSNRIDVKNSLKGIRHFAGSTGKISFEEGQFARPLRYFTVKSGRIVDLTRGED